MQQPSTIGYLETMQKRKRQPRPRLVRWTICRQVYIETLDLAATDNARLVAIVIDETWTLLWGEEPADTAVPKATQNAENAPLL